METIEQVRTSITSNFYEAVSAAFDDAPLLDSGIINFTGVLEVKLSIEEAFGIEAKDSEMPPKNPCSIERTEHFVSRKKGQPLSA